MHSRDQDNHTVSSVLNLSLNVKKTSSTGNWTQDLLIIATVAHMVPLIALRSINIPHSHTYTHARPKNQGGRSVKIINSSTDQHKKVCTRANRPLRSFWMPCFLDPAKNKGWKKRATGENCLRPLPAPSKSHAHREGIYGPWVRTRPREGLLGILSPEKNLWNFFIYKDNN